MGCAVDRCERVCEESSDQLLHWLAGSSTRHSNGTNLRTVARLWWSDVDSFEHELRSATDERLMEMHRWATEREQGADRPGMGRNPKARRLFRTMRQAAEQQLEKRGLRWS